MNTPDGVNENLTSDPKYVTVLPDYLDITMKYRQFYWIVIAVIFIGILIIIVISWVGVSVVRSSNTIYTNPDDPSNAIYWPFVREFFGLSPVTTSQIDARNWNINKQIFGRHDDPGTTITGTYQHVDDGIGLRTQETCESVPYRKWENGKCNCLAPFWGKECTREYHHRYYKAIGNISPEARKKIKPIKTSLVHRQSFPFEGLLGYEQTTCDQECSNTEGCIGYLIDQTAEDFGTSTEIPTVKCTLFSQAPDYEGIVYDPTVDSNLFLARSSRLNLSNRVILYRGKLRNRFWTEQRVTTEDHNLLNLGLERLNQIHFYPEGVINDDDAIIAFSHKHFTLDEALTVITSYKNTGKLPYGWYIYIPQENVLNPPHEWTTRGGSYWVMAISQSKTSSVLTSRRRLRKAIDALVERQNNDTIQTHVLKGYEISEESWNYNESPEITGDYTGRSSSGKSRWSDLESL